MGQTSTAEAAARLAQAASHAKLGTLGDHGAFVDGGMAADFTTDDEANAASALLKLGHNRSSSAQLVSPYEAHTGGECYVFRCDMGSDPTSAAAAKLAMAGVRARSGATSTAMATYADATAIVSLIAPKCRKSVVIISNTIAGSDSCVTPSVHRGELFYGWDARTREEAYVLNLV